MIQGYSLTDDDFAGLEGCNEYLIVTRPHIIQEIHSAYFEAGADIVETDTFGSSAIVLAEYGIADQAYEISKKGAEIAKKVALDFSSRSFPRYVAGSVGPGTKLITLGHTDWATMYQSYFAQILGLIEGGCDLRRSIRT